MTLMYLLTSIIMTMNNNIIILIFHIKSLKSFEDFSSSCVFRVVTSHVSFEFSVCGVTSRVQVSGSICWQHAGDSVEESDCVVSAALWWPRSVCLKEESLL